VVERAVNLFRVDLKVLERGQQLKRLKQFYEAEHPQTKQGGDKQTEAAKKNPQTEAGQSQVLGMKKALGKDVAAESAATFTKDLSEKTGKSETTIREEVQVASRIPEKVQTLIKDLAILPTTTMTNDGASYRLILS
jgi:hypothetical protein